jgi:aryl-alcohol dehydrogenase-like predicted oxidoreductase
MSQIVWSPLAQGVLTGKYRPGQQPPSDSRAASSEMGGFMRGALMSDATLEAVQQFRALAERHGFTAPQLALAWVLREPNVASAIVGASRPEQVDANASASGLDVDPALLDEADRLLAPHALG